jgi:hypothetical protein
MLEAEDYLEKMVELDLDLVEELDLDLVEKLKVAELLNVV